MSERGAVLVTGTSSGIGRAIALLLDQRGYRVFAGVRRAEDGEALRRDASDRLTPVLLDVTDQTQVAGAMRAVESAIDPQAGLFALINNAGIAIAGPLEHLPLADLRRTLEVNVVGQVGVIQACLPLLRRGGGRIIQVTSGARAVGLPFLGAYVASKAALGSAVDVLRRELGAEGLPVSEVLPGFVRTPLWSKYQAPADRLEQEMPDAARFRKGRAVFEKMARWGKPPEAVAHAVLRALEAASPRRRYVVGMDARLALLTGRFVPSGVVDWFIRMSLKTG